MSRTRRTPEQIIADRFARILRRHMRAAEWTRRELATKLGRHISAVWRWTEGKALPDVPMLLKLAELFDVTIDQLVSRHAD